MKDDTTFDAFRLAWARQQGKPPVQVELSLWDAWCLLTAVQLACRHPSLSAVLRAHLMSVTRQIQDRFSHEPLLCRVAEMGWDPACDEPFEKERGGGKGEHGKR